MHRRTAVFAAVLFLLGTPFLWGAPPTRSGSAPEERIAREINAARNNPAAYAAHLQDLKKNFSGNLLKRSGNVFIRTKEGVSAVEEAIRFLKAADSVPALQVSRGLSLAARDHVRDQSSSGAVGHEGSDGSQPADRAARHGSWERTIGENISYGAGTAREVVMGWIIDDGVPDRGHRKNLFSPKFQVMGIAHGPHPTYRTMSVVDLAGGYREGKG